MRHFKISKIFMNDKGNEVLVIRVRHSLKKNQWKDRTLVFQSESPVYKKEKQVMSKTTKQAVETAPQVVETTPAVDFEMAEMQKPFLESDYFVGLCEIATASVTGNVLYIPDNTLGIFNSLFFKRCFARKESNGGYLIGNFQMQNRYLYQFDKTTATYTNKKEMNYNKFIETVKSLKAGETEYTVFSLEPVKSNTEDLSSVLG